MPVRSYLLVPALCRAVRCALAPLLAGLALLGSGPAHAELTIRFAHVVTEDTPKGLTVQRFAQLVAERAPGRIRVVIYSNAQPYGDSDEFEALQAGAVEMLAPSLSKFGRVGFPEFELFDLPFLFNNLSEVRQLTEGPLGQRLLAGLERQGLVGLGYLDNGFKHMSANRPLLEPADFQGLRMRIQGSRVIAAQMRALGVTPVTLSFSQAREALQRQIVQGTENPLSNFWTQRMDRVQSDLSLTQHAYLGYAVITSQRFWRSLTEADRRLLAQALREALAYGNQIADQQNDKALIALRRAGTTQVHTLSPAQRSSLRAAVQPVYEQLGQRIGPAWLSDAQQARGR
jgi:C4-dicarboxylate-binding protein DctP